MSTPAPQRTDVFETTRSRPQFQFSLRTLLWVMTGSAVVSAMAGWVGPAIVFGVFLVIAYAMFVGCLVLLCGVGCIATFSEGPNYVRAALAVAFAGAFLAAVIFSLGALTVAAVSPPSTGDDVMIGVGWLLCGTFIAAFLGGLIAGFAATSIAFLLAVIRPFLPPADPLPAGDLASVLGAIVSFPLWMYVIPPLVFLTIPRYLIRKAEDRFDHGSADIRSPGAPAR